ncbi:MAG: hypothetical protein HY341_01475 [Candidatus Kerfeldbacteria bacterium]|nr:hypothetical protein [Candidatus Kerfeldbacteria bacterium]
MTISTLVFWGAWALVVTRIDPDFAGFVGLFIFYVSLLFALIGTFMLLGLGIRSAVARREPLFRHLGIALRQAILFSILVVGSLLLQGNKLFTWWNVGFFIAGLALLEYFFLMRTNARLRS